MNIKLDSILLGKTQPFGPKGLPSAIHKTPIQGIVTVTKLGLQHFAGNDEQGDTRFHGGEEKAIHYYPFEHYAIWKETINHPVLDTVGAFGENFSATGLIENKVCVGDVFQVGSARIQISQGRQPCWKLNVRFGTTDMAKQVQNTGRTGWYFRVLEEGETQSGDVLKLIERPNPDWDLAKVLHYLYIDKLNYEALEVLASLPYLNDGWQQLAQKRLDARAVESWHSRINTPE